MSDSTEDYFTQRTQLLREAREEQQQALNAIREATKKLAAGDHVKAAGEMLKEAADEVDKLNLPADRKLELLNQTLLTQTMFAVLQRLDLLILAQKI